MKKRIWSFLIVLCLVVSVPLPVHAEGDGLQTDIIALTDENRYNPEYYQKPQVRYPQTRARSFSVTTDFEEYIVNALKNLEEQIDISYYQIPRGEASPAFFQVVNNHPELFYVCNEIVCHSVNNISRTITVSYTGTPEEIDVQKQELEIAADKAALQAAQSMTDVEKALVVHDYLIQLCEYDKERFSNNTVPDISHSAYGALVEKIAVCDGYGKAYKYIMQDKLGINCELVTSDSMNHAWNMIQIDGKWYHVDATWDDPVWDCIGRVKHEYFLLSDQAVSDTVHKHKGWVTDLTADSTLYDDTYWAAVDSAICYYQGNWYYSKYQDYNVNLVKRGMLLSGGEEVVCTEDAWTAEGNSIYTSSYMFLSQANDQLYFSANTKIKRLSADGTVQDVFTPEAAAGEQIFGFTIRGKNLCYVLQSSSKLEARQNILTHELPELELLPIQGVSAEDSVAVYDGTAKKISPLKGLLENDEVWFAGEDGRFNKEQPEMIDAGNYRVLYKVERPGYQVLYGTAMMNIEKAEPSYKLPSGLGGYSGNPLASLGLSGGFRWQDASVKMYREGKQKFLADYTPSDSKNYKSVKGIEIEVTVKCPYANSGHKYVEEVTKEPTETEKGEKVKTCSVCGDIQTEEIPATKPEEPEKPTQPEEPEKPTQPEEPEKPTQPEEPEEPEEPTQPVLSGITAADVKGVYNGRRYMIEIKGTQDGDIVEYAGADGKYQAAQPELINAGSYKIMYKVTREGYQPFIGSVQIDIGRANPTYTVPGNLKGFSGAALGSVELPDSFLWQSDPETALTGTGTQKFYVCYRPTDQLNYMIVTDIEVSVEVKCPGHQYKCVVNKKATETQKGKRIYTCKLCSKAYTEEISMLSPARPTRVSNLKVTNRTPDSLSYSWKKTAGVNYRLMFYRGSKVVSTQYVTGNTCTFKKLKSATVYTLRVTPYRVVNRQNIFAKDTGSIKTATSPAKAKLSTAKRKSSSKVRLAWKKVARADGYEISMKTGNGKYKKVKIVGNGKTCSFTMTELSKKKAYSFRVRAYTVVDGKKIYGAYSNVKKVRK